MTDQENVSRESCPKCGEKMVKTDSPYCQACGIIDSCCPTCRESLSPSIKVCPHCGADI